MTPPTLYTIADVAKHLGKSVRWLQDFVRHNPSGRMVGRSRIFTEGDLAKLIDGLPRDQGSPALVRAKNQKRSVATRRGKTDDWAELQRLLSKSSVRLRKAAP